MPGRQNGSFNPSTMMVMDASGQVLHPDPDPRAAGKLEHSSRSDETMVRVSGFTCGPMACQASFVGLLLLHERTCRPRRPAGKVCVPVRDSCTAASKPNDGLPYSMTSSALASSDAGIVRPSVLAVLRLMTSSVGRRRSFGGAHKGNGGRLLC